MSNGGSFTTNQNRPFRASRDGCGFVAVLEKRYMIKNINRGR